MMLILVYIVVSVLTEMLTNNAAAILMVPVVLSLTRTLGVDAEPFMIAIMMAGSASSICARPWPNRVCCK